MCTDATCIHIFTHTCMCSHVACIHIYAHSTRTHCKCMHIYARITPRYACMRPFAPQSPPNSERQEANCLSRCTLVVDAVVCNHGRHFYRLVFAVVAVVEVADTVTCNHRRDFYSFSFALAASFVSMLFVTGVGIFSFCICYC